MRVGVNRVIISLERVELQDQLQQVKSMSNYWHILTC